MVYRESSNELHSPHHKELKNGNRLFAASVYTFASEIWRVMHLAMPSSFLLFHTLISSKIKARVLQTVVNGVIRRGKKTITLQCLHL